MNSWTNIDTYGTQHFQTISLKVVICIFILCVISMRFILILQTNSITQHQMVNTLRPGQNGRHFADAIFKCIFLNENVWIPIKISLKFVPKSPINNIPALVEIMAWRRPGDKLLSQPMMVSLLTHICVTRPQWVKVMTRNCTGDKSVFLPRVLRTTDAY